MFVHVLLHVALHGYAASDEASAAEPANSTSAAPIAKLGFFIAPDPMREIVS